MSEHSKPVKKSLSLSQKTYNDLVALTDALGVNVHSYMVNELAKCIQRDSLALSIQENTNKHISSFIKAMEEIVASSDKLEGEE